MNNKVIDLYAEPMVLELPADLSERELIRFFTLTAEDRNQALRCHGVHNKIGFALQVCALRMLGAFPDDFGQVPQAVIHYLARQLGVSSPLILDYPKRDSTQYEQRERIRRYLGFRPFDPPARRGIELWLLNFALQTDRPSLVEAALCRKLLEEKLERPAAWTVQRLVQQARARAEAQVLATINTQLKEHHRRALEDLLVRKEDQRHTVFQGFKPPPPKASPNNLMALLARVKHIESLKIEDITLAALAPNRVKRLAGQGLRYDASTMFKVSPEKRYAILVCFLQKTLAELRDAAVEMFDDLVTRVFRRSERDLAAEAARRAPALSRWVGNYRTVAEVLLDETIDDRAVRTVIWDKLPKEKVAADLEAVKDVPELDETAPQRHLLKRYGHAQQFFPPLLDTLRLRSRQVEEPLLRTLEVIQKGELRGKRDLPPELPTDFLSARVRDTLGHYSKTDRRHLYELGTMEALKNALRAGDIYVEGGHRYADFYAHLLPDHLWQDNKSQYYAQLHLPENGRAHLDALARELDALMERVNHRLPENEAVSITNGRFSVSPLEAQGSPESVLQLRERITRRIPKIRLPDLLMQVDALTHFSRHFHHLTDRTAVSPQHKINLHANFIAQGCNLGLFKMADLSPGLSYEQLAWVADWFIREETVRPALAELVNFHRRLPLSAVWGEGLYSASDAQRFGLRGSSLMGDRYLPEFGFRRRGVGFYTFVSDQYAPFYVDVTSLGVRESVYALDGLLGHESELSPVEHYVDTAGYAETVFAMFHLMGIRFAPRLKDLPHQQLYRFHKDKTFEHLDKVVTKTIDTDLIVEQWDEIVRLAASVKNLVVAPSLLLRRMGSYSRKSRLVRAFQELGHIDKTLFILNYVDDPHFRRRVLVGINKLDIVHQVARSIFYGRQGEVRVPGYQEQLHRASCLVLILMAILVWNTLQMAHIVEQLRAEGFPIKDEDLKHVSPFMHEHVIQYGEYHFDLEKAIRDANAIRVAKI